MKAAGEIEIIEHSILSVRTSEWSNNFSFRKGGWGQDAIIRVLRGILPESKYHATHGPSKYVYERHPPPRMSAILKGYWLGLVSGLGILDFLHLVMSAPLDQKS